MTPARSFRRQPGPGIETQSGSRARRGIFWAARQDKPKSSAQQAVDRTVWSLAHGGPVRCRTVVGMLKRVDRYVAVHNSGSLPLWFRFRRIRAFRIDGKTAPDDLKCIRNGDMVAA